MDLDDRIPNTLPDGIGITTAQFVGYVLFNLLCCIFIWFRPQQLRPYFHFASALVFITLFVLLGWAVGTSEGYGSVLDTNTSISSTRLGWQMVGGMMSVIGSIASGILNQNDFTRFAKKPSHVTWSQTGSFFISSTVVATIGVVVTAATQKRKSPDFPLVLPFALYTQND
jgi:NCS1 family nucleobase:cation symporter-1